jgi:hypothetical protein
MTIFAVLMPTSQPALAENIKSKFEKEYFTLTETQWLISTTGTAAELSAKLGIYDAANPSVSPTGLAVVFATSSYFGRAQQGVWEWLKAKLESPPSA